MLHAPALPAQQPRDPPIAIPPRRRRQRDHAGHQPWLVLRHHHPMPGRWPCMAQHPARPPRRDTQPVLYLHHRLAPPGRAQKCPEATSFKMALSRAWSATSCFRRVFSCSSAFSRFAWSRRNPPYACRHRKYGCSPMPSFLHTWGTRRPRLNSTSAWRRFVMICSVLHRLRGILPPGRFAQILPLGLEPSQGARSVLSTGKISRRQRLVSARVRS